MTKLPAMLVHAQNVHDYFIKHAVDHGWEDLKTFFCVRPPFQSMLITYDHTFYSPGDKSRQQLIMDGGDPEQPIIRRVAVSVDVIPVADFERIIVNSVQTPELDRIFKQGHPDLILQLRIAIDAIAIPGRWFTFLEESGQVIIVDNYGWCFVVTKEEKWQLANLGNEFILPLLEKFFAKHGAVTFATLQFMNCRNVEVVNHVPTRQQRRQAERERRTPPLTYKTLVIHPIGKRYQISCQGRLDAENGVNAPLHICRGHFKDYRSGNGLGRWHRHGIWWWSPQVRGSAEHGRIEKDYDITAEERHDKV